MNRRKFVMIGGGGCAWTPKIATDLFLAPELADSELVLVDIDPQAADLMQRYLTLLIKQLDAPWTVRVGELDEALDGADGVCVSIATGGFEAMQHDYHIPEKFGIYHSVGDTVGPGGISRTLRNVPVFVDIAKRMEKFCPDTWLVHVTNPLAQITRCIWKATNIKSVGLCHNFLGTRHLLGKYLGVEPDEVYATSFGVNHFTWLGEITAKGKDASDQLTVEGYHAYEAAKVTDSAEGTLEGDIAKATGEGLSMRYLLNFQLYERFGLFPAGAASHVAENFPHYLHSPEAVEKHLIKRKGVLPNRADAKKKLKQTIIDRVEGREAIPEPEESIEQVAPIMVGLCTGKPTYTVVNLPNKGQIPNLPMDAVVETWGHVTWNRIDPIIAGPAPAPILGMLQLIISEEEMAVEAALTGDRQKVIQAMYASPLVADKDCIEDLADALLEANAALLPQFASKQHAMV